MFDQLSGYQIPGTIQVDTYNWLSQYIIYNVLYMLSHLFLIISQLDKSYNFYHILGKKLKFQKVKWLPVPQSLQEEVALKFKAIILSPTAHSFNHSALQRDSERKGLNVSSVPYELFPGISPSPGHLRVM